MEKPSNLLDIWFSYEEYKTLHQTQLSRAHTKGNVQSNCKEHGLANFKQNYEARGFGGGGGPLSL